MSAPILPISAPALPDSIRPAGEAPSAAAGSRTCSPAPSARWNRMGQDASASVERFLSGEGEDLHTTVLATQRAELAFEMFQQVRNKVVSAYQEIMRMQM